MSRGLWFAAGAGAGVYAMSRVRRVAESLTADGLRDRLSGLSLGVRLLADEVRTGQAEAEAELRERFGLAPARQPELAAAAPRALRGSGAAPDGARGSSHHTDDTDETEDTD